MTRTSRSALSLCCSGRVRHFRPGHLPLISPLGPAVVARNSAPSTSRGAHCRSMPCPQIHRESYPWCYVSLSTETVRSLSLAPMVCRISRCVSTLGTTQKRRPHAIRRNPPSSPIPVRKSANMAHRSRANAIRANCKPHIHRRTLVANPCVPRRFGSLAWVVRWVSHGLPKCCIAWRASFPILAATVTSYGSSTTHLFASPLPLPDRQARQNSRPKHDCRHDRRQLMPNR